MGSEKLQILMASSKAASILVLAVLLLKHLASCCNFPSSLHMDAKDPPWYSHVRADGSRDVEYYIRHTVMEIHYPHGTQPSVRWKCSMLMQDKLMLKRQDHLVNNYYRCVQFIFRSRSVVQILWSPELKTFDLSLCDDGNLVADPWPLIWFGSLEDDLIPCPFSGGFDMKVIDSQLGENGCNLMLRPMRMEAECLAGEGVTFNFVSNNCLPDIKMYVKQSTVCVTAWQDDKNHYIILRRSEERDLWCLVMPINRGRNVTAHLFSDLTCQSDIGRPGSTSDIKFFTLLLHTREFPTLCEDEYDHCSKVTCNTYVRQECQKSCGTCNSNSLPRDCEYPKWSFGTWFLKDIIGYKNVDIRSSNFSIDGVGNFKCVTYSNNSSQKATDYTAVSLYQNGCRPRYTCVRFIQLGQSVFQVSLSQSYVWPTIDIDLGKSICSEDRFHADSSPIDDRYRSHEGAGKPIISYSPKPEAIDCNITFVHTLNATLPKGYVCPGSLYQHCEDPRKLRLEFNTCGSLIPSSRDYKCLATFQGHYWERILLVQNVHDDSDAICFVFSQFYPIDAYVLVAGQCDQKSFNFARTGLRKPVLKFTFRTEPETCKSVNLRPHGVNLEEASSDSSRESGNHPRIVHVNSNSNGPVPGSHPVVSGQSPSKSVYDELEGSPQVPSARPTSLDQANLLTSADDDSGAPSVTSFVTRTLLLFIIGFVYVCG